MVDLCHREEKLKDFVDKLGVGRKRSDSLGKKMVWEVESSKMETTVGGMEQLKNNQ